MTYVVSLIEVIVWPAVVIVVVFLYREDIPRLIRGIGSSITSLSAGGVLTLEFTAAQPPGEALDILNEMREPSTTTDPPPSDAINPLLELAKTSTKADYLVIDLRKGRAWLTSRLYLFALVLPPLLKVRSFVFVTFRQEIARYYLGQASPESVARLLENTYPWLRTAKIEAHLNLPLVQGSQEYRYTVWQPYDDAATALKRVSRGYTTGNWDVPRAEALDTVVRKLVDPIDPYEPAQIDIFVNRFLQNYKVRRPHRSKEAVNEGWVHLGAADEHADWIVDEQQILDLFGSDFRREWVVHDSLTNSETLNKAVLQSRGDFVAVIDNEGRFTELIDRREWIERVAAAKA